MAHTSWGRLESRGYIRLPNWFRWHIRNNYEYVYITDNDCHQGIKDINRKRMYRGHYVFNISDEALIELKRPVYIYIINIWLSKQQRGV